MIDFIMYERWIGLGAYDEYIDEVVEAGLSVRTRGFPENVQEISDYEHEIETDSKDTTKDYFDVYIARGNVLVGEVESGKSAKLSWVLLRTGLI